MDNDYHITQLPKEKKAEYSKLNPQECLEEIKNILCKDKNQKRETRETQETQETQQEEKIDDYKDIPF